MKRVFPVLIAGITIGLVGLAAMAAPRIVRVQRATESIPQLPGAQRGGERIRYWPGWFSWDDRSSARVQQVFALDESAKLLSIARHAHGQLTADGWYLVTPPRLDIASDPQLFVWQRDPDERLDLSLLWPLDGMTREQRLYGDLFPPRFLDAATVFEWNWALDGPRSPRPAPPSRAIVQPPLTRP